MDFNKEIFGTQTLVSSAEQWTELLARLKKIAAERMVTVGEAKMYLQLQVEENPARLKGASLRAKVMLPRSNFGGFSLEFRRYNRGPFYLQLSAEPLSVTVGDDTLKGVEAFEKLMGFSLSEYGTPYRGAGTDWS